MKIAFVHPKLNVKGGAENIAVWYCEELRRRGHDVTIFTAAFDASLWAEDLRRNVDVHVLPPLRKRRVLRGKRRRFRDRGLALAGAIGSVDVVIGHNYPAYVWAALGRTMTRSAWRLVWLCEEPRRRLYAHVTDAHVLNYIDHTPPGVENEHLRPARSGLFRWLRHAVNRRWDKQAVRACDLVIANSTFTARNARRIFGVEVIPCHLGIRLPPPAEYAPGDYVAILTSLAARKNVHNAIRAIRELVVARGRKDMRLRIAGAGRARETLEGLVAALGIGDHVTFLGPIPDEELPEFYRRARCLVYSCIDEPFGLVPLEALAVKTPVVVSNHGGPAEVVQDGVTGLFANPFDPGSIADAVQRLWTDPAMARRMGEAGEARVRDYYSVEAAVGRKEELLRRLV